jgi:hypothetical protein
MVVGFNTNNSTYYIDTTRHVAWGGKLGSPERCVGYIAAKIQQGQRGIIKLANGKDLVTGVVQQYI